MMKGQITIAVALMLLSCGSRPHELAPRDPPAHPPPGAGESRPGVGDSERQQLVARAEQSLTESLPVDYRRPFSSDAPDRSTTISLFLDACRADDKPSCWMAWQLDRWNVTSPALTAVLANCVAGDVMSCRALPTVAATLSGKEFRDTPGVASRSNACWKPSEPGEEPDTCDVTALRRECLAGFPIGCLLLPGHSSANIVQAQIQALELSRDGCRTRIVDECNYVADNYAKDEREEAEQVLAMERICPIAPIECSDLSAHYLKAGDVMRARDAAERSCQYGRNPTRSVCMDLAENYLNQVFPEPVSGRGNALLDWACESPIAAKRYPACKVHPPKQRARPAGSQ